MCISTFWLSEFALKTFLNTLHRSASKFIIYSIIVSYNIWWGREEQDRFHEENSWIFMLSVNNFTLSDVTLVSFRCVIVWRTQRKFSLASQWMAEVRAVHSHTKRVQPWAAPSALQSHWTHELKDPSFIHCGTDCTRPADVWARWDF